MYSVDSADSADSADKKNGRFVLNRIHFRCLEMNDSQIKCQ